MTFQSGDLILNDRYRIEAQIGEGAYGTVYRAVHADLGVTRAIKVLRHDAPGVGTADFDAYRRRFQLEFQVVARLDHPNVLKVHDFVEENGVLYAVLEYAPGGSLADLLQARGPLPPLDVTRLLLDAARGLDALHEHGVVHRDVKPSNILVDARGRAKIGDLGLAQVRGSDLSQRSMLGSAAGVHPGTSYYRSPEHESYAPLMPTSDVYGLGCVAFEVLTGQLWRWARRKVTCVRDVRADVPRWLDELVMRMLCNAPGFDTADADDPTKRYVDMHCVIAALEAGRAEEKRREAARKRRQQQLEQAGKWAGMALGVVVLGLVLWGPSAQFSARPISLSPTNTLSPSRQVLPTWTLTPTPQTTSILPDILMESTTTPTLEVQLRATTHVVRAGENIFEIAFQYGITVDSLARANGIANPALIYVGQKLTIPQVENQEMEVVSTTNSTSDRIHIIQPGENLFRVAVKYNVDYYYLARYNNISDPVHIYVGQKIRIPQW